MVHDLIAVLLLLILATIMDDNDKDEMIMIIANNSITCDQLLSTSPQISSLAGMSLNFYYYFKDTLYNFNG